MEIKDIIIQIEKLPVKDKMLIIEQTAKSIRESDIKEQISRAVEELREEYKTNRELTSFTDIDFENFYESR
ncbi:MAG: hypothetical protein AB1432_04220 [Bacteroidota bacterium]|jgi:hypothetical protein